MWSQIVLCLLVGFTYASQNPGWKDNSEYVYQVRARSLASLNQISNNYSGIILRAKLHVRPRPDGNLDAKILEPKYASIHSKLRHGWESEIPDSELAYKPLPVSTKPFQIVMSEGAIHNLIVDGDISNWEANVIKSIVSQLQLDTKASNIMSSHYNLRTQEDLNSAVFKTMEETVTGFSETLYEIHPLPEYIVQSSPWLVPLDNLSEEGNIIEVVKTKNFTNSPSSIYYLPSYKFGVQGIQGYEPANKMADFASRTSVSRAVITGNLNRYTIQSIVTIDQVFLSPLMVDKQKGSVNTKVNLTLQSISEQSQPWEQPSNPVKAGLVYRYNAPFASSNKVRPAPEIDHASVPDSAEFDDNSGEYLETSRRTKLARNQSRLPRSSEDTSSDYTSEEDPLQPQPKLNEPPQSPLLPFTVGYDGQAFSQKRNIKDTTRKLAQEIGQDVQHPENIPIRNTVGKYMTLTSLVRLMNTNEIQEVANALYSTQKSGPEPAAWKAYRDAVAQAGTGPAYMNIKQWIATKKIQKHEAAEVIATAAYSVRVPTEEYMKDFFVNMIQNEQVMSQPHLNQSALLAYTQLVHQVCVHKNVSHDKYPVHSFGPFCTETGRTFVINEVIEHLKQKLDEAVKEDDTHKIHVYIRALGNVGHRRILAVFEPYLEGKRHVSQYQRILMVTALDRLVRSNPRVARSVLYKIYQNPTEHELVRAAAVYQLMRTNPSASMLQRMASYTNIDSSHHVNAAVKSTIERASELKSSRFAKLRVAAHSAKHLLTSRQYGAQFSHQHLRNYVSEQMHMSYKDQEDIFGSEDSLLPRGIKYSLHGRFGGFERQLVDKQAMVSSVDDLVDVFHQQTQYYQEQQQQKASQPQHQWSSEHIAQLLNLQNEVREGLEGNMYVHMGALQKMWSFDNETLENLPDTIQYMEQQLKNGKQYDYSKMIAAHETVFTFPTGLGLPFIYTYDQPIFVRFEATIQASANPPVSSGKFLNKPDSVESQFEIHAYVSGKTQSQFGFFTPFDSQHYSAGYDKNFQVIVPLRGNIHLDVQKKQLRVEMKSAVGEKDIHLVNYGSWPYTAQNDIYAPHPERNIIKKQHPYKVHEIIGQKSTGIAFNVQITSDERMDYVSIYNKLRHHDVFSAMLSPWVDENIQYADVKVIVNQQRSSTKKIVMQMGHKQSYDYQNEMRSSSENTKCEQAFPAEPEKRQEEFIRRVSSGIKNSQAHVVDTVVTFQGQDENNRIQYIATLSGAKSNVDPNGSFLALFKKNNKQEQPLKFCLEANTFFPNTNGLDVDYAMSMNTTSNVQIKASLTGPNIATSTIRAHGQFLKSDDRLKYLQEQQDYKECKRHMQEGNYQLPICAKMTAKANLLDQFRINVNYEHLDARIINSTYKMYSAWRHYLYPRFEENIVPQPLPKTALRNMDIDGEFSVDLNSVTFYITSEFGKVHVKHIKLNEWAKHLLVPHPVFHTRARLMAYTYGYDTYRPICVVDKTAASTFDNKTYPAHLGNDWTVLMQFVPRRPLQSEIDPLQASFVPEQLKKQIQSHVVFIRASEQGAAQKELKLVVQTPETEQRAVEIEMKPSSASELPKLYVDKKELKYSDQEVANIYNGYIQVYALPNNEVKLEVQDSYYVIFDGERVKLTVVNSKFRDASRGLCGTFTGHPETDFLSAQDCIVHKPEQFIASYTVSQSQQNEQMRNRVQQDKCYKKKVQYVNVISYQDSGVAKDFRYTSSEEDAAPLSENRLIHKYSGSSCTRLQTKYVVQNDETCFTLRPLPVCKQSCHQRGSISKNVAVHCVKSTTATQLWKNEIDKGASPDFSQKSQSRTIEMEVPQRCLP